MTNLKTTIIRCSLAILAFFIVASSPVGAATHSPEIELMKLEFELACELTKGCKDKVKNGKGSIGRDKVVFRTYKEGTAATKKMLEVKRGKKTNK